jgi:hypothetical protein
MPPASLILPYTVLEKNRKTEFNLNMELASILCLAEARRKKRVIVGSYGRILFISKLYYPFWAVPWEHGSLVLDGLQIASTTVTYMALPNMELFFDDVERGHTVRDEFRRALSKHAQTFSDFSEMTSIHMPSIIGNKILISDMSEYVGEALSLKADVVDNITLIPPRLNEEAAYENAKKVLDLYKRIQSDLKGLEQAAHVLNEISHSHQQKVLLEMALAREFFQKEIDVVRPIVDKKVETLLKDRDLKIEKMKRAFEVELSAKLREKERRQRELERLELNRTEYKRRLEVRKSRHDRVGTVRWEHNLRSCENKILGVRDRIHELAHYIEKIEGENQEEVNSLKYSYQTLIDAERNKVAGIEASLESVTEAKKSENGNLELMTTRILRFIGQMAEQKRLQAAGLKSLTISWQPEQVTLLGVPIYLVGYEVEDKLRYQVYPPLRVMSSEGIVKKIEKTLLGFRLASRIQLLLQPRSRALNRLFNALPREAMKTDKILEESLHKIGASNNLLTSAHFKEALAEGVRELRTEGWIKQEEGAVLLKAYA